MEALLGGSEVLCERLESTSGAPEASWSSPDVILGRSGTILGPILDLILRLKMDQFSSHFLGRFLGLKNSIF